MIKWGFEASNDHLVTMREELFEKETKIEESRTKRGHWEKTKKVVKRDRFPNGIIGSLGTRLA